MDIFHQKVETYSVCCQSICAIGLPGFQIFAHKYYLRFPFEIGEKVPIFVEKLKKMKPPKMTFRSQIEPSVKSYESFMFIVFAEFQIGNHNGMMDS